MTKPIDSEELLKWIEEHEDRDFNLINVPHLIEKILSMQSQEKVEREILYRKIEKECITCLNHPHIGKNCFNCHGTKKVISYKPITSKPKITIEECKRFVAEKFGYESWGECQTNTRWHEKQQYINEAMELYRKQ